MEDSILELVLFNVLINDLYARHESILSNFVDNTSLGEAVDCLSDNTPVLLKLCFSKLNSQIKSIF